MKDFILILGVIPDKQNETDGMFQREIAIDNILRGQKRIYVEDIDETPKKLFFIRGTIRRIKKNIKELKNRLDIFKGKEGRNLKFYKKIRREEFSKLCKAARIIYAHSLYMATLPTEEEILKYKDKIIFDIHGCLVEELEFLGKKDPRLNNFKERERLIFNNARALVAVSNNMIEFYREKYEDITTDFILLPIFTKGNAPTKPKNARPKIIYSGGSQKWQNVDLMIDSISKISGDFDILILTPNVEEFKKKLEQAGVKKNVKVKTVNSSELYKEYQNADFGYVLRDDIVVNRVACPTKIIEYLTYGIIPVVLQPNIGDFNPLGYSYILNDDLISGHIPTQEELSTMRQNNCEILSKLNKIQEEGKKRLRGYIL